MSNKIKVVNGVTFFNGEVVTGSKRQAALSFSRANAINSLNRTTSGNGRQYRIRQINGYNKELGLPPLDHTALDPSYQATVLTGNPKIDSPNGVDMRQRGDGTYYVPTSAIEAGENEILTSPTETNTNTVEETTEEETSDIVTSSETAASNQESTEEVTEESTVEENPTENLTDKQKKAINPEEELGDVNPEPELDRETGDPGERKPPGNNRDEVITTADDTSPVTEGDPPPEEEKETNTKPHIPPVIIQHPEDGTFFMGRERDDKVTRKRDIQLVGSKSNSLRLFHDGGFELKSSEDAGGTSGSSILQVVDDAPLLIKSKGDIRIQCDGRFSVVAHDIKMKAEGSDDTGGITLKSEQDITIDAANRAIIKAENITFDAKDRILSHSVGWQILIGQVIRLHEPKTKICPAFLREYIDEQIKTLRTN